MAVYRRFASLEDLLVTVASTPMSGRIAPSDTGTVRCDLTDMLRRRIDLIVDQLEGVLHYRMLWRNAPLRPAEVEATIEGLLRGAAP